MTGTHRAFVDFVLDTQPDIFRPGFREWLERNRHVWVGFARECDDLRDAGRAHYSARTIVEMLRHHSALRETDGEFKLCNDAVPDLARLYLQCRPEAEGFFSVKARAA